MTREPLETAFALAAAAVLLVSAGAAVAAPTGLPDAGEHVEFDADVPDEYAFTPTERRGTATVDGQQYRSLSSALGAADAGDVVRLEGRFDPADPVVVRTPNLTLRGAGEEYPVIDGDGDGDVLVINASGVTVDRVWVRNSGWAADQNDAGIWISGASVTVRDSRVTNVTFGVWVDGVRNATVVDTTIVGRESVHPRTDRGNGIQLWDASGAYVADNRITDARDGIYYSWASGVVARNNTLWDLRYAVHYMYSDRCTLANNTAFDNDVGYALMVSQDLRIVDNVAVNNTGQSGHGIMLKSIDRTTVRGNHLVGNDKGLFVYNSLDNVIAGNLVAGNAIGVHLSAGSVRERVSNNTFVRNRQPVRPDVGRQVVWNESVGNYWAGARTHDVDDDGVSETRYRPAGAVQHLVEQYPSAAAFTGSPAFSVIRLAERTLPVVESPGVLDRRPLVDPPHDWRRYYE